METTNNTAAKVKLSRNQNQALYAVAQEVARGGSALDAMLKSIHGVNGRTLQSLFNRSLIRVVGTVGGVRYELTEAGRKAL